MANMLCPACWGSKTVPGARSRRKKCITCSATGACADRQLSPHFALSEMVRSQTALRKHLSNAPSDEHVANLVRLCKEILEPMRAQFGPLRVTSGLRLPAVNGSIAGAARRSAHEEGWAADIVPIKAGVTLKQMVDWVIASSLSFDQVIYEGTWVHVARFSPNGKREARQALMMFPNAAGKPTYSAYKPNDPRVV
jgi:zinc D-Ala-D-Ala carboxypeptidase